MKTAQVFIVTAAFAVTSVMAMAKADLGRHHTEELKLCVPDSAYDLCRQMTETARHDIYKIQCVSAPDKIACIDRIIRGDAHWTILDPEELYVAYRFLPDGVVVSSEIRSAEYSTRDYRYAPSVVVRKSANIQKIDDLQGKRSCHTAYGRNAGWKVPFSHLFLKRQLNCTKEGNALERDLATVAGYFDSTCLPGQWSPDKEEDSNLKKFYPKLCQLCKNPETCSNEDLYSGYDGALKCLTENNGDVAWTKYDAIRDFFKLNESSSPRQLTEDYELLCRDGSRMPLNSEQPCSWARRPWRTVVVTSHFAQKPGIIKELQEQITNFRKIAEQSPEKPEWLTKVLEFFEQTDVEYHYDPNRVKILTPQRYLQPYNYSDTFWHPSCGIYEKAIRICVYNQVELQKCQALKLAAIGQRISPGFNCVLGTCAGHCSSLVSKGDADLVIGDAKAAYRIQNYKKYNPKLVPILRELEPTNIANVTVPVRYALAVIRGDIAGEFTDSIKPLKGKRSCHGSVKSIAGIYVPINVLKNEGQISGENCQLPNKVGEYFSQSCIPGVKKAKGKFPDLNTDNLCSLCMGDGGLTPETVCSDDQNERYYGSSGALLCLKEQKADVAFVDHLAVLDKLDATKNPTKDDIVQLKLLCKNGTVTELENFRECYWGTYSTTKILARGGDENKVLRENARLSLLRAQEKFRPGGRENRVFKLFGEYYGTSNVIFQDSARGFQKEVSEEELLEEQKIFEVFNDCGKKHEGRAEGEDYKENEWKPVEQI